MLFMRIFLGGIFVISGFNGFFHFIPITSMSTSPLGFISPMISSGDFFYVIRFFEAVLGLMILAGMFMPIALIMLFPITMNLFMFHMTAGLGGIPMSLMLLFANVYMIYAHREHYMPMIHS